MPEVIHVGEALERKPNMATKEEDVLRHSTSTGQLPIMIGGVMWSCPVCGETRWRILCAGSNSPTVISCAGVVGKDGVGCNYTMALVVGNQVNPATTMETVGPMQ